MIGIRYVVVAVGGPGNPATDADVQAVKAVMEEKLPFTVTVISERASNRLTFHLIQEQREAKP
jgi:molybdopterin biosynthesis enzyme MoaB